MSDDILQKYQAKKIRYIRHYYDENEGNFFDNYLDPFKTKSWQNMFGTNDPLIVEQKCKEQSFVPTWSDSENKRGTLKLVHTMNATRKHPQSGDEIWHNHMNVLHIDATSAEFAFSAQHLQSWMYVAYHYIFDFIVKFQRYVLYGGDVEHFGQHTTHKNGELMNEFEVDYIRSLVWKHTHIYRHQKDDIVMIDNFRIGHGRQPYKGKRVILTTWA